MKSNEMDYITITAFCTTLKHSQKINPYKLQKELEFAAKYGLKYIYIKNTERTAKFEIIRIIQLLKDWDASKCGYLLIDFPKGSKGMNFKRI